MPQEGITVVGHGRVEAVPDLALLSIGVQASAKSVAEARQRAAESAQRLVDDIRSRGVAPADIQTSHLNVGPRYDFSRDGGRKLLGYDVSNTVSVTVRDIAQLAAIVDGGLEAGGDATTLDGVQFALADSTEATAAVRKLAMQDAATKAAELAAHAGVALGLPVAITEGSPSNSQPMLRGMAMAMEAKQSTPIEAGTTTVTCDVTVTYAIVPGTTG